MLHAVPIATARAQTRDLCSQSEKELTPCLHVLRTCLRLCTNTGCACTLPVRGIYRAPRLYMLVFKCFAFQREAHLTGFDTCSVLRVYTQPLTLLPGGIVGPVRFQR